VFIQALPPGPVPVLGGVTEGCCPPLGGGGGGGGGAEVGCSADGVLVGPGEGVLVQALLVGVDVGQPPVGQGVLVAVGGSGVDVGVAGKGVEPTLCTVAPRQPALGHLRMGPG
jgi:hypothetical protein